MSRQPTERRTPVQEGSPRSSIEGDPAPNPDLEPGLRSSTATTTDTATTDPTAATGANPPPSPRTPRPQPRRRRKKSFREVHHELLKNFGLDGDRVPALDGAATEKPDIPTLLVADAHRLLDSLEAELEAGNPTSINGKKLGGVVRRSEERFNNRCRVQLQLARAFLVQGDLTSCQRLLTCGVELSEVHLKTKAPLFYVDKAETKPSTGESPCHVRGCPHCGGDLRETHASIAQIAAACADVPRKDLIYFTLTLGSRGGLLVDDIYDEVVAAMLKVTGSAAWNLGFVATVRDHELFNKLHEPWGHVHVIAVWRAHDVADREKYLADLDSTWSEATEGTGYLTVERLRDLGRSLRYNAKGYRPHTGDPPHLGISFDQMKAIARLSMRPVGYHFTTGSFAPSKLNPGKPKRKRKSRGSGARSPASSATPELDPSAPALGATVLKTWRNREEVHTPQAALARANRRARPSRGRVRITGDGAVVDLDDVVLRVGEPVSAPMVLSSVPGPPPRPSPSTRSPDEERHAVLAEVLHRRGSGSAAVGAPAGGGKSSLMLDVINAQPKVPTVALAFNRSAAARLALGISAKARANASTIHRVGLRAWREEIGGDHVVVVRHKVEQIVTRMAGDPTTGIGLEVVRLVRKAKALAVRPDDLSALGPLSRTSESLVRDVLTASIRDKVRLDEDDMIYMPVVADIALPRYDFICVDETQDLTPVQVELLVRLVGPARALVVFDRWQAINLFRHAHADAPTALVQRLGLRELALTYSRRCPVAVAEHARQYSPSFQAMPGASPGYIDGVEGYLDNLAWFTPGMVVLARTKPPLKRLAAALVEHGSPTNIMFNEDTDYSAFGPVKPRLPRADTINLSTVHAFKGQEAAHVSIIGSPVFEGGGLTSDEHQAELNTRYVAVTRSLDRLTFLDGERAKKNRST